MEAARHPEPPPELQERDLPMVKKSGPWFRFHAIDRDPLYFGRRCRHRFDSPEGEFGTLYMAGNERGAFIETFGQTTGIRVVSGSALAARALSEMTTDGPLQLVDLTEGLPRMGTDGRMTMGDDYGVARRWSGALHDHPSRPDGLYYQLRHDPTRFGCTLFDRASARTHCRTQGSLMESRNSALLAQLLDEYDFGLIRE